jgi:hypothetical protein
VEPFSTMIVLSTLTAPETPVPNLSRGVICPDFDTAMAESVLDGDLG